MGFIVGLLGLIVMLVCWRLPGNHGRGRALSAEEIEAMNKECLGKSQKEVREIQKRYLYE